LFRIDKNRHQRFTNQRFLIFQRNSVVSIKTHFPSPEGRKVPLSEKIPRAILLIRNPLYAFPAYFNILQRVQNKSQKQFTHAPLNEWITWRNDNFDRQLQVWRRHTEYWIDSYSKINRLVITFEKLTDRDYGPDEVLRLAEFLNRSERVDTLPPEDIPCVWQNVVELNRHHPQRLKSEGNKTDDSDVGKDGSLLLNVHQNDSAIDLKAIGLMKQEEDKLENIKTTRTKEKKTIDYVAPFNRRQLRDIIQVLTQLLERYRDEIVLAPILVKYIDEAAKRSEAMSD